jgi:hypothetical protein
MNRLNEVKDMINILHLLWIVPAAAAFGFMLAALLASGNDTKGE